MAAAERGECQRLVLAPSTEDAGARLRLTGGRFDLLRARQHSGRPGAFRREEPKEENWSDSDQSEGRTRADGDDLSPSQGPENGSRETDLIFHISMSNRIPNVAFVHPVI